MRFLTGMLCAALVLEPCAKGQGEHHHELTAEEVGSVHFATSCSNTAEASFNRAVALLHSFQYEQARQAFSDISAKDPSCAMAQWGVAMSYYHGLWKNGTRLRAARLTTKQQRSPPRIRKRLRESLPILMR